MKYVIPVVAVPAAVIIALFFGVPTAQALSLVVSAFNE